MAVNIPSLNVNAIGEGLKDQNNYESILDILQRYRKELNFYLMNLDLDNMPAVAEDIDWIHQDIDGVKITVGNNAGDIAALVVEADQISATVGNNAGDIAALVVRANQISASVGDNAGNIANLSIIAGEIQSSVMDLNTYTNEQLVLLDGKITTLNTTVSDQYSSITQRADEIELSVGNVVTTVATNYTNLDTKINTTNTNLLGTITNTNSDLDTNLRQVITNMGIDLTEDMGVVQANLQGQIATISTTVTQNQSDITQRAENIELSVTSLSETVSTDYTTLEGIINGVEFDLNDAITSISTIVTENKAAIDLRADSIVSSVSSLSTEVTTNYNALTGEIASIDTEITNQWSEISQLSDEITAKVTIGEVTNYLSINRDGVQINANNIDLTGITTIYGNNGYTRMGGTGLRIVSPFDNEFSISWDTYIGYELGRGVTCKWPDVVWFDGSALFNGYVNFSDATIEGLELRFA